MRQLEVSLNEPETTEEPTPETVWFDDRAKCQDCERTKDRVIARSNLGGHKQHPKLCDDCFDERTKPCRD